MMLGVILARAGVPVTVLEKHDDFLRDFRGDTVHASTLTLLDELGLSERFSATPHRVVRHLPLPLSSGAGLALDLGMLPGPHKHIAMVPQWDLLDLLADAGREEPSFTLRMGVEVTALLREGGRVVGVRYRDRDGADGELRATVTVACDGRTSAVRAASGLRVREFGVPMDVWWFRLPRRDGDLEGLNVRVGNGAVLFVIDRGSYFQIGLPDPQGQRRAAARGRHRGLPRASRGARSGARRPRRRGALLGRRQAARRARRSDAALVAARDCCASETRPTRCPRSAGWGSTSPSRTPWPPHASSPRRCAVARRVWAIWPACRCAGGRPRS